MAAAEADKARKTEAKNKAEIEEEKRKKENLFNLRYHQDITDRTEVQRMLSELRAQQDAQRSANEARGAVLGETKEQQIAEENGLNKAFADSVANIASNASALKDGYLSDYENSLSKYYQDKREHNSRMAQIEMNGSNQWAQAATNAFGAAASAAGVAAGAAEGTKAQNKTQVNRTTYPETPTSEAIHNAPSRSAQYQAAQEAMTSPIEKRMMGTMAGVSKTTPEQTTIPNPQWTPSVVEKQPLQPWEIKVPNTWVHY